MDTTRKDAKKSEEEQTKANHGDRKTTKKNRVLFFVVLVVFVVNFFPDYRPTSAKTSSFMGMGGVWAEEISRRLRMEARSKRRLKRHWNSAR